MQSKSILFVYLLTILVSCAVCVQDEDLPDNDNGNYVDVHQHPKNGFSCAGKKSGEYYADLLTSCQLYYVCLPNAQLQLAATSFACPNTTRFNQATRVCSPADQVYCRIAERYYENVHGSIDSKNQSPNEYLPEYFDKTPWQLNRKPSRGLIVPPTLEKEPEYRAQTERPRPTPRPVQPKIENAIPKADSPLHTSFSLSFNNPQNTRVVARTRASTTATSNTRRGSTLDLIPAINNNQPSSNRFKPSISNQNSRSRLTGYAAPGRPATIATTPSTTTTTTTTTTTEAPILLANAKPADPKSNSDYIYDYVYEDQPAASPGQPNLSSNKPPAPLPPIPTLDDAAPPQPANRNTNAVTTSNSNLGSLFNTAVSRQPSTIGNSQPQLPKLRSQSDLQRPPSRNQLPQSNGLNNNYFNSNPFSSNPFSSNPFASNPFSHNNSPTLIRQKRQNEEKKKSNDELVENNKKDAYKEEDEFSCNDKLPGVGYADIQSACKMFHICLPISKGKYKDYQLFCESGGYNQYTAQCEPLANFDCKRSKDFYLYNKQVNLDSYLKNKFRISKQLADIKN